MAITAFALYLGSRVCASAEGLPDGKAVEEALAEVPALFVSIIFQIHPSS